MPNCNAMNNLVNLAIQLSPENLTCDGELPRAAVRAKRARLLKEWREQEKALGRKVSEEEVWNYSMREPNLP